MAVFKPPVSDFAFTLNMPYAQSARPKKEKNER